MLIISFMRAWWLVLSGCLSYLAYVYDVSSEALLIDFVPVVREFTNVFPINLPSLPSERDIDFSIDLESITKAISLPP